MGLYQLIDSAMCMTLLRSRLPELSYRQAFELTFLGAFGLTASGRRDHDTYAERLP